jgi:hypothetical protein
MQQVLDTATKDYRALAEFAQDLGARIALEPLNASIMNIESSVWTLAQAMRIVEAVDRPNFGICLDFWNIWQNANICDDIRACGDRITLVRGPPDRRPGRDSHTIAAARHPRQRLSRRLQRRDFLPRRSRFTLDSRSGAGYQG